MADPNKADDALVSLFDVQAELAGRAVHEVNRLRRRVRELEQQIASSPSYVSELQDRVTLLEQQLAHGVKGKENGNG